MFISILLQVEDGDVSPQLSFLLISLNYAIIVESCILYDFEQKFDSLTGR